MKRQILFTLLITFTFFINSQEFDNTEEVVVTANKKEETVQEIPMNISVITEADIEERGITNPEDFLRTLAGVTTPGGSRYFTFRGLNTSQAQRSPGTSSTYVDDIRGLNMNIFDVQRIEVLRGPQGTLYGSNAIGGTIRYITNKPSTEGFASKFSVEVGEKEFAVENVQMYNAMVNVPLSENVALRAVASKSVDPGIYQNVMTGREGVGTQRDDMMRVTLGFEFDRLDGYVRYEEINRNDIGDKEKGNGDKPGTADIHVANCDTAGAGWWYNWDGYDNCARVAGIAADLADYVDLPGLSSYNPLLAFAAFRDEVHDQRDRIVSLNLNYAADNFNSTLSMAAYETRQDFDTDWSRIDMDDLYAGPLVLTADDDTQTTELRVFSNPGTFEWTVGYFRDDSQGEPNQIIETQFGPNAEAFDYIANIIMGYPDYTGDAYCGPGPYCADTLGYPYLYYGSYQYYDNSSEEAFFGQLSYNVSDRLTVTYGLRNYQINDSYKGSEFGVFYIGENGCDEDGDGLGDFADGVTCNVLAGSEQGSREKFSIAFTPSDDLTLFMVQSEGYRPGGNNAALPYFCESDPEAASFERRFTSDRASNFEVGGKYRGSFNGNSFSLNATYFQIDWEDIIIGIAPACGWSFNFNGGQAETSGLEIDLVYDLTDNLYLDFSGAFMSAETTVAIESFDAEAGARLPGTVENQFNLGLTYEAQLLGLPSYARLDLLSYGDSYATFSRATNMYSPDYTKLNLNAGMNFGNSAVQLSVDNLTDERTEAIRYAIDSPSWRPRDYLQWIPPRSVTVRYIFSF